jgi:hypothetical protein
VAAAGKSENGVLLKKPYHCSFFTHLLKSNEGDPLSPPVGEAPQGVDPLTPPHLRVKTHKKFQAVIIRVRVIFWYVLAPVKILKLPAPPCLGEALRRVVLIIIISFLKKSNCRNFLVLSFNDDKVREKITLAVTLTIKKLQLEDVLRKQTPHLTLLRAHSAAPLPCLLSRNHGI